MNAPRKQSGTTLSLVLFALSLFLLYDVHAISNSEESGTRRKTTLPEKGYVRIIPMSPSLAEVVCALGLTDRIVGVSDFCTYPPQIGSKPTVGGFMDTNFEAILALQPDLILLLPSHRDHVRMLNKLGLHSVTVPQDTVDNILKSIETIGALCGADKRAVALSNSLRRQLRDIQSKIPAAPRPRVLIVVGRDYGSMQIKQAFIAGNHTFHSEILSLAGGRNAYTGSAIAYPSVSEESILAMNPDVIIDLIPDPESIGMEKSRIVQAWQSLPLVNAVKNHRVVALTGTYVSIPGPRIVRLCRDIFKVLYPGSAP